MVSGSSISANLVPLVWHRDPGYLFHELPSSRPFYAFDNGAAKPGSRTQAFQRQQDLVSSPWAYDFPVRAACSRRKLVQTPEDLAGLKIRTLLNPVITECLRLMGAAAYRRSHSAKSTRRCRLACPPTGWNMIRRLSSPASSMETSKNLYALTQHIFSPLAIYFTWTRLYGRMEPKLL